MERSKKLTAEDKRVEESRDRKSHWKRWGPYLSERAWGTVREDYSANGDAWEYLPHDQARSKAYRWNEDGIAGICDRHQHICFALALWNGSDPILKERLFGLTGKQGNHGEDVKEYYFYLDSTPTHSYMKYLYKYPQAEFPYAQLVEENRRRGKNDPEFELMDTGVFDGRPLLRCRRRIRQGHPGRYTDPHQRHQSRPRACAVCTCCRPSGSAIPGRGRSRPSSRGWRKDRMAVLSTVINIDHAAYGRRYLLHGEQAGSLVHRKRNQQPPALQRAWPGALQGRHQRLRGATAASMP